MKKEYNYTPEEPDNNEVREPAIEYKVRKILPVITEEELAETITREELLEYIFEKIDQLPGQ